MNTLLLIDCIIISFSAGLAIGAYLTFLYKKSEYENMLEDKKAANELYLTLCGEKNE